MQEHVHAFNARSEMTAFAQQTCCIWRKHGVVHLGYIEYAPCPFDIEGNNLRDTSHSTTVPLTSAGVVSYQRLDVALL